MNVFNIIGPIMIGPSSSHTAGAVRLGRVVNKVAGSSDFKELDIELSGSFARTYRGHGTDYGLPQLLGRNQGCLEDCEG